MRTRGRHDVKATDPVAGPGRDPLRLDILGENRRPEGMQMHVTSDDRQWAGAAAGRTPGSLRRRPGGAWKATPLILDFVLRVGKAARLFIFHHAKEQPSKISVLGYELPERAQALCFITR